MGLVRQNPAADRQSGLRLDLTHTCAEAVAGGRTKRRRRDRCLQRRTRLGPRGPGPHSPCLAGRSFLLFALQISWVMVPMGQYTHQLRGLNRTMVASPSTVEVSMTL